MSLPTLVIMKEGFVIYARSGTLSLEDLRDLVGQAHALDMDEIRRSELAVAERHKPVIAGFFAHLNALHAPGDSHDRARSSTAEISSLAGNRSRSSRAG